LYIITATIGRHDAAETLKATFCVCGLTTLVITISLC